MNPADLAVLAVVVAVPFAAGYISKKRSAKKRGCKGCKGCKGCGCSRVDFAERRERQ